MMHYVGIDGCKAGWFAVGLHPAGSWELDIFANIDLLWGKYSGSQLLLIDIPIGLCEGGVKGRACDTAARRYLGAPRASSVFTPPVRSVLGFMNRETASESNYSLSGRRIGCTTWGIVPKIHEIDRFLRSKPEAMEKIREIHPEVLFWALNGGTAMSHGKKESAGFEERLRVLRTHFPQADELAKDALHTFRRKDVARDDILDALAAAVTGLKRNGHLSTIPNDPEMDQFGFPMEMVYYKQR